MWYLDVFMVPRIGLFGVFGFFLFLYLGLISNQHNQTQRSNIQIIDLWYGIRKYMKPKKMWIWYFCNLKLDYYVLYLNVHVA